MAPVHVRGTTLRGNFLAKTSAFLSSCVCMWEECCLSQLLYVLGLSFDRESCMVILTVAGL